MLRPRRSADGLDRIDGGEFEEVEALAVPVTRDHRLARKVGQGGIDQACLLYTSPSPRDGLLSRMPSSA